MAHVFISYSKNDRDHARRLADPLLDQGFDVWVDDRIDYGENWWKAIGQAIRDWGALVIMAAVIPGVFGIVTALGNYGLVAAQTRTHDSGAPYNGQSTAWVQTRMAGWTDAPTPKYTPPPTPTLSLPEAPDSLQVALDRARDFSGGNRDWRPFSLTFNGVDMVLVPAGCFMMGSESSNTDQQPVHRVCFDAPFWIDRTEVTNAQYGSSGFFSGDTRPRESVTWTEAQDFCVSRWGACQPKRSGNTRHAGRKRGCIPGGMSSKARKRSGFAAPVKALPQ